MYRNMYLINVRKEKSSFIITEGLSLIDQLGIMTTLDQK